MAIAKKGTRLITVDGRRYRWVVSPDSGYMVLVVEAARQPRCRLLVHATYDDAYIPDASGGHAAIQQAQITPVFVRRCIDAALAAGWKPLDSGPEFHLRRVGGRKNMSRKKSPIDLPPAAF